LPLCRGNATSFMQALSTDVTSAAPVFVLGGMNMDIVAATSQTLLAGDSNPGRVHCAPGGVARNVAENLSRLGHAVALVSAVGTDAFGDSLLQATLAAGVRVGQVGRMPDQRTATYLSVQGPDGDMAVAVNDMEILEMLSPAYLSPLRVALGAAPCVVLDANLRGDTLTWLLTDVKPAHAFVDAVSVAKCGRLTGCFAGIHLLKVNRMEAQALTGIAVTDADSAMRAAHVLHTAGVHSVVVSMGHEGVAYCSAEGSTGHCAAGKVTVVSASGAGDALLAGLVHGHLTGMAFVQAIAFAMQCAEMTLTSPDANHHLMSVAAIAGRNFQNKY
jgi:pseudouridine kinase